ncbi:MAG: hypothetical protein V1803_02455 [Candidatus Roizmanbacteria bacterium]
MSERFGATVKERFWRALGNIIIPNSVFFGVRIDEMKPSPSREMLERLRPKKIENNEDFPPPITIDLRRRSARMDPTPTSFVTAKEIEKKIEKKREGDFCSIACALIALSNEAIIKNPQNLERCLRCNGQGVRQLF